MKKHEDMRFDMLNAAVRDEMRAYFVDHKKPQRAFLVHILENDLQETCKVAGAGETSLVFGIAGWLTNFAGSAKDAYGSRDKVAKWLKGKAEQAKKAEPKQEQAKKAEPKQEQAKKAEPKQAEVKNFGHE